MFNRGRSGYRQHHWRPSQEPGEGHLCRAGMMRFCDLVENFTGDAARTKGEPRDEHDPILLAIVHDIVPFAVGETVTNLHRDEGHDPASPLNMFLSDIGEAHLADLPLTLQFG